MSTALDDDALKDFVLGDVTKAGVACEREGNTPVSPKDILDKLDSVEKKTKLA